MISYLAELLWGKPREGRDWTYHAPDGTTHKFGKKRGRMFFKKKRRWLSF